VAGGRSDFRGGILGLLDLIEEHRAAFDYDWRTRFHLPLAAVPDVMSWGEAVRLAGILRADPSSMLAASMEGWKYPVSREAIALARLYDLEYAKTGAKKRQPYPMPWTEKGEQTRHGNAAGRTPDEIKAILRTQFGQPEAPV
jgi:hypothetical protein